MNTYHVYPANEEREHILADEGHNCECVPRVREVYKYGILQGKIIVHSAFDHREIIEEAERIKDGKN